ncbi:MAG TPA: aminodeoxychorismate/anthranilate synthase component II [Sphingomonadales bacterium]|nr:aminodeoxychorismate/anthranilate synthase component II [Sphingomonadales bacterium]
MILLIDNYDSFTFNIYQTLAALDEKVRVVRNDRMLLPEMAALAPDAIVLSPGPGRPEEAGISLAAVRHFSGRIPILGICLGHQAIAAAFGGRVVLADEVVHGKDAYIFHTRTGLYRGLPLPFAAGRYHSLAVEAATLPDCLVVEAETGSGECMGLRHREHLTFGVQFHPESVLTPEGERVMKNFLSICLAARAAPPPLKTTSMQPEGVAP